MKNVRKFGSKRQKGFSLLEIIVVIAVIAGLLFFVFTRSNEASNKADSRGETDYVMGLIAKMKSFKIQSSYEGLTSEVVAKSGEIDKAFVATGNVLINTSQLPVVISATDFGGGAATNNAWQIEVEGYNRLRCTDVAKTLASNAAVKKLTINSNVVVDQSASVVLTPAALDACTDENNGLTLVGL